MSARDELFAKMAGDVGVKRYMGESDNCFFTRVAYTGSRYWISAFCMDDGADGACGLSRQALNRRLKSWISQLSNVLPHMNDWFEVGSGEASCVYNRLIDIGEIVPNGFSDRYLAQPPRLLPVSKGYALIIGLSDPTVRAGDVLGYDRSSIVESGLASLVTSGVEPPKRISGWWEAEWELLPWARASEYEGVEYASPMARAWGLRRTEVWSPEFVMIDGVALARTSSNVQGSMSYYAVRGGTRGPYLCPIDQARALELYYMIRKASGNPVTAQLKRLDDSHVQINMPLGLIPGEYDRVLEVVSWPVSKVSDRFTRIMRVEATDLAGELLARCNVALKEA